MKKTYLLGLAILLFSSVSVIGQNLMNNGNLEVWDNTTTPTDWDVIDNINQESAIVYEGTYSAAQMSESSSQKFRQDVFSVIGGQEYTISYYYLDNTPDARTRIWSYWMESGTYLDDDEDVLRPTVYSEENSEWQHYSVVLTAPLNANEFRFDVRTYKQDGNTGGFIYFDDFSVSGDVVIYPEPTNYPTTFAAATSGLSINVSWDESTGDQLPTGYLLLGEKIGKGAFEVPIDGIAVENDLDWSDNKVSVNVGYGEGEYLFEGLDSSTEYSFTIYPFTNSGANIDYKTDGTAPTAGNTTANITAINTEGFDTGFGSWTGYSVVGDQVWEWAETYGNPPGCAKMTGFDGAPFDNEDWLISPALNLTEYNNITFGFDQARNYASNDGLFVYISTNYDGTSDPNTATWDDISSSYIWHEGGWDFIDAGTSDISGYSSETTYIAFVFTSNTTESATWEVDNAEVLGVLNTGINNSVISKLIVYPNPASDKINIRSTEAGVVKIMNITGKLLMETEITSGTNSISIETLSSGLYIVETIGNSGIRSIGKFTVR